MTTSLLDVEELKKFLPSDLAATVEATPIRLRETPITKPVSIQELMDRAEGLFTTEELDALARRIDESCERIDH
jgi:hypothetical protein